jgi:cytochrome b
MRQQRTRDDRTMLVWDAAVRTFHWLLVLCFAGAWLTADSERFRLAHITLGYTSAALVGLRLVWGLVGTRYARFANFMRGPHAAWAYLRSLPGPRPQHHVGHNPAGALAIAALLGLSLATSGLGWAVEADIGGDWLAELHEGAASLMLAIVALHVLGVAIGSLIHRENLVRAMIDGRKRAEPGEGIRRPWRPLAGLMLAAVLVFWAVQMAGAGRRRAPVDP